MANPDHVKRQMVKVYSLKDHVKKNIRHPSGGYRFGEDGSSMWPMDQFTQRRIRDGDVSLAPAGQQATPQATRQRRQIEAPKTE